MFFRVSFTSLNGIESVDCQRQKKAQKMRKGISTLHSLRNLQMTCCLAEVLFQCVTLEFGSFRVTSVEIKEEDVALREEHLSELSDCLSSFVGRNVLNSERQGSHQLIDSVGVHILVEVCRRR